MDREAFGNKVSEIEERLMRYACLLVKNESDAQDVVQDAFLRAWEKQSTLRDEPKYYISRAVRNAAIDLLRTRARHRLVPFECDPHYVVECGAQLFHEEFTGRVDDAKKSLSKRGREFFEDYVSNMSYEQIAAKYEVSIGTVKSTLYKARKTLQELLGDLVSV